MEIALRSIVPTTPPLSPARTPQFQAQSPHIAEQTHRQEQQDGTGPGRIEERSVLSTSPQRDEVEEDGRPGNADGAQPREGLCGLHTLAQPILDLVSTSGSVQIGSEQVDDDMGNIQPTEVPSGGETGLDAGQEQLVKSESDVLQTVEDGYEILSPASPSSELLFSTVPPNSKRKRQRPSSKKLQTSKRQCRSKVAIDADPLPVDLIQRVRDIATFDDVEFLWERLQLLSSSTPSSEERSIRQGASRPEPSLQKLPRRQRLELLWSCIGDSENMERWATVLQRICQAEFFGQYLDERTWYNEWKEQTRQKKVGRRRPALGKPLEDLSPLSHPLAEYVDLCFPKATDSNREKAKKKFENLVQTKEPWVKFGRRFGTAVFVVISAVLRDEQQVLHIHCLLLVSL